MSTPLAILILVALALVAIVGWLFRSKPKDTQELEWEKLFIESAKREQEFREAADRAFWKNYNKTELYFHQPWLDPEDYADGESYSEKLNGYKLRRY